jgi:hypothetical protein
MIGNSVRRREKDAFSKWPLIVTATTLTAFNDNAAITYLASLVPGFSEALKYVVMAGAVTGGGLTVIANSPNPAGQSVWRAKLFRYFRLRVFKATIAEPRFERIWLQSKKRLHSMLPRNRAISGSEASPSSIELGEKNTSRSEPSALRWSFRKVLGVESVKDLSGNVKL